LEDFYITLKHLGLLTLCVIMVGAPVSEADTSIEEGSCTVKIIDSDSSLNVRAEPYKTSQRIGKIYSNSESIARLGATYSAEYGEWIKIQYQDISGWASADYLECHSVTSQFILESAAAIITALKSRDFELLATYVHRIKGVRFSPYAYVDVESDQIFQTDAVRTLDTNIGDYLWGYYDGSGDPIKGTFDQYYDEFIFSHDFTNSTYLSIDTTIVDGNTIDNSLEVYPDARIVEFNFPSSDSSGLDWSSLRIVLEWHHEAWRLVGLVHDHWTT